MGGTCSNANELQRPRMHSRLRVNDDDEKDREYSNSNTAEIDAMAKEVILLSTRNANLQQELDELKQEMSHNLDVDVLRMCQVLNINVVQILAGHVDVDGDANDYNIAQRVLELEVDNKYLRTLSGARYKHLFYLLMQLKASHDVESLHKIVIMQLYRLYYAEHAEGDSNSDSDSDGDSDGQQLYALCKDKFTTQVQATSTDDDAHTTIIDNIRKMVRDEVSVRAQCESLFLGR